MASDEYDLHRPFINRNCFGIPVRQWIEILSAVKADIATAQENCGGDGLGCKDYRASFGDDHERRYRVCGRCPMRAVAAIRKAVDAL